MFLQGAIVKNVIKGQIEVWMHFRFYHRKLAILSKNLTHTAALQLNESYSLSIVLHQTILLQHSNHGQFQRAICVMANSLSQSIHSISAAHRQLQDLVFCDRNRQGVLKAFLVFILGISSLVFPPSSLFNHIVIYLSTGDSLLFHIPKLSLCFLPLLLSVFPINALWPYVLSHWGPHY